MKDLTYVIHTRIDCRDRLANFKFCINFIQTNFNTNILVVEQDTEPKAPRFPNVEHVFLQSEDRLFNRTHLVNTGVRDFVKTPYVCLLDMDVFTDPWIYVQAHYFLRDYSLIYPFDGRFIDIPQYYNQIPNLMTKDIAPADGKLLNLDSVGGLQFIRTQDFMDAGMTNEFIQGWGYEDDEFLVRFTNLGYGVKRLVNPLYHFSHIRTFNSDGRSPHIHENKAIFDRVKAMNREETLEYIKTFTWL